MGLTKHKVEVTRETIDTYEVSAKDIAHAHQLMQRQLDLLDYDLVGKVFPKTRHGIAKYRITGIEFSILDRESDEADQKDSCQARS